VGLSHKETSLGDISLHTTLKNKFIRGVPSSLTIHVASILHKPEIKKEFFNQ
jgi:hypothetical protein